MSVRKTTALRTGRDVGGGDAWPKSTYAAIRSGRQPTADPARSQRPRERFMQVARAIDEEPRPAARSRRRGRTTPRRSAPTRPRRVESDWTRKSRASSRVGSIECSCFTSDSVAKPRLTRQDARAETKRRISISDVNVFRRRPWDSACARAIEWERQFDLAIPEQERQTRTWKRYGPVCFVSWAAVAAPSAGSCRQAG
jgi:hypothetical protein